jgi:T5SS/PEP-CTERM-associated repeat protein
MNFRVDIFGMTIVAGIVLGSVANSFAQTNAVQSGNWSTGTTWDAGEPTDTVPAIINGGFTVTIDSAGETTNLLDVGTIAGQTGNLVMTGGNLFVSDTDTVTEPNLPSIRLGVAAGSTGNFTMSDGEVFIDGATPSEFAIGELLVGDNGTGTMTMTGGQLTASDEIFVGLNAGSSGTLNVSGGTITTTGGRSILVGFAGNGELNVSGTGNVFANFDLLVGFVEGSNAEVNLSGGTIDAGFMFSNSFTGGAGSTVTMTQTGGTFTARIAYVMGQGIGTSTLDHSGGNINVLVGAGDMVVSDGNLNTSTYNISGTATVDLADDFIVGAFGGSNGIVNQSGGVINAGGGVPVGRSGTGVWNMSGGQLNVNGVGEPDNNLLVGRDGGPAGTQGTGTFNQTSGTVNVANNVFLGDFDNSEGVYRISGGSLTVTGNLSVGGALASNAPADRVEPDGNNGPQGQALNADGTFIVSGSSGVIDVGANFLANAGDKSSFRSDPFIPGADNTSTLVFEIFNGSGTSLIDVAGVADLDGAVIDLDLLGGFTPSIGATFNLLEASSFGSTGTGTTENVGTGEGFSLAAEDTGSFSLAVVAGAGVEILRATFLGAAGLTGDYNEDGVVDAADYVAWRKNPSAFGGNPNGYNQWRQNFGESNPGAGSGGATGVPEPASWMLLALGAALGFCRHKGSR